MTQTQINGRLLAALRITLWTGAAGLLLLPVIAMRFTDEVQWTGSDFVFAAVVLGAAGGALELGARASRNPAYLGGMALAVGAAFMIVWGNAAVGFIGEGPNLPNLLFIGVAGLAILCSALARLRPAGMAAAMLVPAAAQTVLGVIYRNADPGPVLALTAGFAVLWLSSAALFRIAARQGAGRLTPR